MAVVVRLSLRQEQHPWLVWALKVLFPQRRKSVVALPQGSQLSTMRKGQIQLRARSRNYSLSYW